MIDNPSAVLERAQYQKPLVNLARPTTWRMWLVSLCAFLVVIQSSATDSFSSLFVMLGALSGAVLTELLFLYKSGRTWAIRDGSAVAAAMILTLLLPNRISPVYAAAGAVFAMAVIKHSFGGLGSNWLNPAAGGWLFIRFSWPASFKTALDGSPLSLLAESLHSGFSDPTGSPLGILKIDAASLFAAASPLDGKLRSFLNNTVFSLSGAELPGGYLDLLGSRFPGIIADRGILALLVGTIIIIAMQANRSWIPLVYLAVFGFFVRFAGAIPYGGTEGSGDILFTFFSGGTLVAAFFLSSDPSTGAKSSGGIFLAVIFGGIASFLFRFPGGEPYGVIFAAVLVNAILPLVRIVENRILYKMKGTPPRPGELSSRRYP